MAELTPLVNPESLLKWRALAEKESSKHIAAKFTVNLIIEYEKALKQITELRAKLARTLKIEF